MQLPMTQLVSDRESLATATLRGIHPNDCSITETHDTRLVSFQRCTLHLHAGIEGDRIKINFLRSGDPQIDKQVFGLSACVHPSKSSCVIAPSASQS